MENLNINAIFTDEQRQYCYMALWMARRRRVSPDCCNRTGTHTHTHRETSTLSTVDVDTSPETNIYFLIASTFYFRPAHVIIDSGHQLAAEKTYAIRRNQTQPPTRQSVGKEV